MASYSRSGLNRAQREKFLADNGFTPMGSGKGSHESWENKALKELYKKQPFEIPQNLMSNIAQNPWEIPLCNDPARKTWQNMVKQVQWCTEILKKAETSINKEEAFKNICKEYRENLTEICAWKKTVKHALKMGQQPSRSPVKSSDLQKLKVERQKLKKARFNL